MQDTKYTANKYRKQPMKYTGSHSNAHIMGALVVHSTVELPTRNSDQNIERTATYIAKLTNTSN